MNIGIVLVTFNRLGDLKKTIRLYEQQTKLPAYILVVDNHSNDGTAKFLAAWAEEESIVPHKLITLPKNIGGSGGFHAGTKVAAEMDAEWIWLADDDAYPNLDALQKLETFTNEHLALMQTVAALCTKNYSKDRIALGHRCRSKRTLLGVQILPVAENEYDKEFFYVDEYSFVGAVIRKEALMQAGLPNKDFFIYADDMEHGLRVRKQGEIICVPSSVVFHMDNNSYSKEASWRDYYATRNILLTLKWHYGNYSFIVRAMCRMLTAISTGNPEKMKVFWTAIGDAHKDKVGIHPVYRPGWQPTRKFSK